MLVFPWGLFLYIFVSMKNVKYRDIAIKGIILTLLYITYVMCATSFFHTHIINGVRVVHSHPFKDTPHGSLQEVQLFNLVNDYVSTEPEIVKEPFDNVTRLLCVLETPLHFSVVKNYFLDVISLRGPPFKI